jgi:hypothetical protein
MLSNKQTADDVEKSMRQCSALLDESVRKVMETCSEEEFLHFRRVIGRIMGTIYLEVMQPIHQKFPDLEPPELRRDSDARSGDAES